MDNSQILGYLRHIDVKLRVQNPEGVRLVDDGSDPDGIEDTTSKMTSESCRADIEHWMAETRKEDDRRDSLMELFNILKNQVQNVHKVVDSIIEVKGCHQIEMNHIEELRKKFDLPDKAVVMFDPENFSEDNKKREQLKALEDEINVVSELVEKKMENMSAAEEELNVLRCQKSALEVRMQRCPQNSPSDKLIVGQ